MSKAVSNLLAPVPTTTALQAPQQPPVDLAPMQRGLAEIQKQHRELREQITTQSQSLQRVEDQLSHVATATDRNTREQQELVEEIQSMGKRQSRFSTIVLILLLLSIAANVVLYLLIKHIIQ
jgi:septal ring factor EnvC (AmiA/AmiB activator)